MAVRSWGGERTRTSNASLLFLFLLYSSPVEKYICYGPLFFGTGHIPLGIQLHGSSVEIRFSKSENRSNNKFDLLIIVNWSMINNPFDPIIHQALRYPLIEMPRSLSSARAGGFFQINWGSHAAGAGG